MLDLFCPECQQERAFEQPVCSDEHGADCPDFCCSVCGLAVFDGPLLIAVSEARTGAGAGAGAERPSRWHAA